MHQGAPTTTGESIPSMSLVGQIGHSEYSLIISKSVRKRQTKLMEKLLDSQQGEYFSSKLNQTKIAANDISVGNICDSCESNRITLDRQDSFMAAWFSSEIPECSSRGWCNPLNDTMDAEMLVNSFNRVLSFIKLPFRNRSWWYGSVRFPIWENSYSDILIGFSTSSASAAAA